MNQAMVRDKIAIIFFCFCAIKLFFYDNYLVKCLKKSRTNLAKQLDVTEVRLEFIALTDYQNEFKASQL